MFSHDFERFISVKGSNKVIHIISFLSLVVISLPSLNQD